MVYKYLDPNAPAAAGGVTNKQAQGQPKKPNPIDGQFKAMQRAYEWTESQRAIESGRNPFVEKNLEGMTLKFGTGGDWTVDTGIEMSPYASSFLVGAGDQIGDVGRGIKQFLQERGLADDLIDEQVQNDNEEILRQLYGDQTFGTSSMGGAVTGAVAEPIGLLLPLGKAKKASTAFMAGAGIGALYGGSMYVDGNESRLRNAAVAAAMMGPTGYLVNKYFNHAVGSDVVAKIENAVDSEKAVYAGWSANSKARGKAGNIGMHEGKGLPRTDQIEGRVFDDWFDQQVAGTKLDETGTPLDWFDSQVNALSAPAKKKSLAATKKAMKKRLAAVQKRAPKIKAASEVMDEIEVRAATEGGRHRIAQKNWPGIDRVLRPLYDAVNRLTPKVAAQLRIADGSQHLLQHKFITRVKPFTEFMQGLTGEHARQFKKLLGNGGFNKATMTFVRQVGGESAVNNAKVVQQVLKQIHNRYTNVGYKIGDLGPDYFPNAVKDLKGLVKKEQGVLDKLYAKQQAKRGGKALTTHEKDRMAEHFFSFDQRFSKTSGSQKKRLKRSIKDDEIDFYHNPQDALAFYIHTAAEDLAKREFFKSFGYRPGKKGLDATGADLSKSVDGLIDQIKKDVPDLDAQRDLVRMLRTRFSSDVNKTWRWVQDIKNLSYAGTLGNFWAAMTQIGDLVFAFHKYGIKAAVGGIFGPQVSNRAKLGIEKAMAELHSDQMRLPAKLADFAFKWSGFNAIDRFGKNVNINASFRVNQKLARTNPDKFMKKWRDHFGDETEALLDEMQHQKIVKDAPLSDNAQLMLWNDLADTQPIGLSEMPEMYLANPNGRIFYAYKTFAMKQFNYMRNQMKNDKNAFKGAYDLTMFATMFVMANGTVDGFKDFVAGKDLDFNDKVLDNLVSLAGTSKYAVDKTQGLGGIILQGLQPVPFTQGGKMLDKVTSLDVGASDVVNQLPIVGKMNKEWLGDY